jgi:hypothetical protein
MAFSENITELEEVEIYDEPLSEADLAYARWYAALPTARKNQIFADMYEFGLESVKYNVRKMNPFATEAAQMWRFIEIQHKEAVTPAVFEFMKNEMAKRSEAEWKARFKKMRQELGWSFDEIAQFIGAESGNSVKSSISRSVPAFAKLAVCVFEKMKKS